MSAPFYASTLRHELAGVPIRQLAEQFGTPLYVYDAAALDRRLAMLSAYDVVRYAQKACSNLAVLRRLRAGGALVDAVSVGEIERALRAGWPAQGEPEPIVYTADVFTHEALARVIELDLPVNCGSMDMIEQYAAAGGKRSLTLRLNPGFGHGHSARVNTGGESSKHGIWHEQLPEALQRAAAVGLIVSGIHVHIGSGVDLAHMTRLTDSVLALARRVGSGLRALSSGGGMPIPYREGEAELEMSEHFRLWDGCRRQLADELGHAVQLEIEPGRFLAAEAGALIAEVRAVKRQGSRRYALLDAGFNTLARPVLYGAYHPMALCPADDRPRETIELAIAGPLCESGDVFTQGSAGEVLVRELPEPAVGDWLVLGHAGAYGQVMASNYNSHPFAAEVMVDDGEARLVRRRQSLDHMLALESDLD